MKRRFQIASGGLLLATASIAAQGTTTPPQLQAGLVHALEEIGQTILGATNFFAINPGPPDAPALETWINDTPGVAVHVNIFTTSPGPPETWLRLTIANGLVTGQQDPTVGDPNIAPEYGADLGTFLPPNPIVGVNPGPPDFPAGLARAMGEIGRNLLGTSKFFSTKISPGPPNAPSLDLWLDDVPNVPVAINVFTNTGAGAATWLRITLGDGSVRIQQDNSIRALDVRVDHNADLSAFLPPSPVSPR